MRVILATDDGSTFAVEVDPELQLQDLQALLEAETNVAPADQMVLAGGRELSGANKTLQALGIQDNDVLLFRSRRQAAAPAQSSSSGGGGPSASDQLENARQQILSDPETAERLRSSHPELVDAAFNNPARFRELLPMVHDQTRVQKERNAARLNADPFDVEAQREIEEAIRRERVLENMEHAMEYSPESFGRVSMLYVEVEVNGHPVKAFVDSGAQATIMNPRTAERCGIMRLVDDRWAGIARGVGQAKIIGRVHSAQIKVGADLFLSCSFEVMEGDVDLLFGLDQLKRHQACIDLEKNCLRIQGRTVRFLDEHELPQVDRMVEADDNGNVKIPEDGAHGDARGAAAAASSASSARAASQAAGGGSFPGTGNTLGSTPVSQPPAGQTTTTPAPAQSFSSHPESAISSLVGLGVNREEAIRMLDATNGDPEMAASMLFSQFG